MADDFEEQMAKAAGQVVVDTAADARRTLAAIFGDAISEFGAGLGDRMRLWRFRNLTRIFEEVDRIARTRKVPPEAFRVLPFGDAMRAVEAASYEEDESVQALWARLILNAATVNGDAKIEKPFVDILKSLSAPEVALLELLDRCERKSVWFKRREDISVFDDEMNALAETRWRKYSNENREASVQNLARLRCITFRPRQIDARGLLAPLPDVSRSFQQWAAVDPRKFENVLREIVELGYAAAGIQEYRHQKALPIQTAGGQSWNGVAISVPEMNYQLTPLGRNLMAACRAETQDGGD